MCGRIIDVSGSSFSLGVSGSIPNFLEGWWGEISWCWCWRCFGDESRDCSGDTDFLLVTVISGNDEEDDEDDDGGVEIHVWMGDLLGIGEIGVVDVEVCQAMG